MVKHSFHSSYHRYVGLIASPTPYFHNPNNVIRFAKCTTIKNLGKTGHREGASSTPLYKPFGYQKGEYDMNRRRIITYPRWYGLLLFSFFILYGGYLWSVGWESPYYRVLDPAHYVVIGVAAFFMELKFVTVSEKHLTVWWLFIPFRTVAWKDITSITIIQKAKDKRDDSVRMLITIAPCVYRTDMVLTAAEFARQHPIKGIFFRIPKKNPEETIRKLHDFCPHFEIPYMTQ